jgi:predicted dehydrogenase
MIRQTQFSKKCAFPRRRLLEVGLATIPVVHVGFAQTSPARPRIGIIGLGVRGKYLLANLPPHADVVALCDCYQQRIESTLHPQGEFAKVDSLLEFARRTGPRCRQYQDYRQLFEKEELEGVIIATPDHHHAQATILACRAGVDVYVEKPLAVTIEEGRAMVNAAAKSGRVVQVGSQQRSMEVNRIACDFIRNGGLGKVFRVDLPNNPGPLPMLELDSEPLPAGMDWDLFCGPTALRKHHRRLWCKEEFKVGDLLWRGWDLWQDYSGHLMTNWGAHSIDLAQLALGMDHSGPISITLHPDAIDEAMTEVWSAKTPLLGFLPDRTRDRMRFCPLTMQYANGIELKFVGGYQSDLIFYGEKGTLSMGRNDYAVEPAELLPPPDPGMQSVWKGAGHVARPHLHNWLDCIETRQATNAPIEAGHRTATICHLANLAREIQRDLQWDAQSEQFVNDGEANSRLKRSRRSGYSLGS